MKTKSTITFTYDDLLISEAEVIQRLAATFDDGEEGVSFNSEGRFDWEYNSEILWELPAEADTINQQEYQNEVHI